MSDAIKIEPSTAVFYYYLWFDTCAYLCTDTLCTMLCHHHNCLVCIFFPGPKIALIKEVVYCKPILT